MPSVGASSVTEITELLVRWRGGDENALDRLTSLVYIELRRLAASLLQKERNGQTLQPTALVHELYLHLRGARGVDWKCRGQFFAISAKLMRRILVDRARKRSSLKRAGGETGALNAESAMIAGPDLTGVDAALSRLATRHPRQAAVVEMRFFGGLTVDETVEALGAQGEEVSGRTVERDWRFARAWLEGELERR